MCMRVCVLVQVQNECRSLWPPIMLSGFCPTHCFWNNKSVCVIPTSCRTVFTIMLTEFALHIPFEAIRVYVWVCVVPTSCRTVFTVMLSEFALHIPFEAIRVYECVCYPNELQDFCHHHALWICPTHSFWSHKSVWMLSQQAAGKFSRLCSLILPYTFLLKP